MSSVCAEQHKYHSSHQLFSPKKALDIPPRKLLSRRAAVQASQTLENHSDMFSESPRGFDAAAAAAALQKFLPYNKGGDDSDDSDSDPYSSDHFRMFEFKVRRCTRSRSHDWTDCPFAHPGEKARRRDPRRYHYSGTVCAEYRRGSCSRGDNCEFAHGVFECWLHPSRYRTEACKDGKNCKRKVCFFAHTPRQLRVLPVQPESPPQDNEKRYRNTQVSSMNHCCMFCHSQVSSSPTSTLFGMSHLSPPLSPSHQSLSPPLSPMKPHGFGQVSRYVDRLVAGSEASGLSHGMSYKDVLNEIMTSLDVMNMNNGCENNVSPHGGVKSRSNLSMTMPWVDVSPNHIDHIDEQQQFILSPSTPSPPVSRVYSFGAEPKGCSDEKFNDVGGPADPDLGWVNDLLM